MSRRENEDLVARWLMRPLCRKYAAAILRRISVPICEVLAAPVSVCWALGYVQGGGSEVLGAWMAADRASVLSSDVIADLKLRGVDRVEVVGLDAAKSEAVAQEKNDEAWGETPLSLQVCPADDPSTLLALGAPARRALFAAADLVADIQLSLDAALARKGAFINRDQAMSFIAEFLFRAQQTSCDRPVVKPSRCVANTQAALAAWH